MADDPKAQDPTEERQGRREQAQQDEKADEEATAKVEALEEDPPQDLADWPDDKAKYKTFGGDDETYEEGPNTKLGPSGLRHHEDGSVSIDGEKVDDPEKYKGDPIPGGPTDPDTPKISGERDLTEKGQEQDSDDED